MDDSIYVTYLNKTLNNILNIYLDNNKKNRIINMYVVGDKYLELLDIIPDKKILWEMAYVSDDELTWRDVHNFCTELNNFVKAEPNTYINILIALTNMCEATHKIFKLDTANKIFTVEELKNSTTGKSEFTIVMNLQVNNKPDKIPYIKFIKSDYVFKIDYLLKNNYLNLYRFMDSLENSDSKNNLIIKSIESTNISCISAVPFMDGNMVKPTVLNGKNQVNIDKVHTLLASVEFKKKIEDNCQTEFLDPVKPRLEVAKLSFTSYNFLAGNKRLPGVIDIKQPRLINIKTIFDDTSDIENKFLAANKNEIIKGALIFDKNDIIANNYDNSDDDDDDDDDNKIGYIKKYTDNSKIIN
jgi:hypothetical protein